MRQHHESALIRRDASVPGPISPSFHGLAGQAVQFSGPISIEVDGASTWSSIVEQGGGFLVVGGSDVSKGQNYEQGMYLIRFQPDGSIDKTFGQGGSTRIALLAQNDIANNWRVSVAISPDGKIVLARSVSFLFPGNEPGSKIVVVQLLPNGSLDATFGSGGVTYTTVQDQFEAWAVSVQRDKKIIVAGTSGHLGSCSHNHPCDQLATLMRYQPNGQPDPNFGHRGLVQTKFYLGGLDGPRNSAFHAMSVQDNGLIVAAGKIETSANPFTTPAEMIVAEYLPTGDLNPSFADNGAAIVGFDNPYSLVSASSLAIQDNGRILVGGTASQFSGNANLQIVSHEAFALTRLTLGGDLDTSFGESGKRLVDVGSGVSTSPARPLDELSKIILMPNGDIYAVGTGSGPLGSTETAIDLVALDTEGTLKPSFGKGGLYSLGTFLSEHSKLGNDALVTRSNRLLITGTHWPTINEPDAFVLWGYSLTPKPPSLICPQISVPTPSVHPR